MSQATISEMERLRDEGKNLGQISSIMKIAFSSVHRHLKDYEPKHAPKMKKPVPVVEPKEQEPEVRVIPPNPLPDIKYRIVRVNRIDMFEGAVTGFTWDSSRKTITAEIAGTQICEVDAEAFLLLVEDFVNFKETLNELLNEKSLPE